MGDQFIHNMSMFGASANNRSTNMQPVSVNCYSQQVRFDPSNLANTGVHFSQMDCLTPRYFHQFLPYLYPQPATEVPQHTHINQTQNEYPTHYSTPQNQNIFPLATPQHEISHYSHTNVPNNQPRSRRLLTVTNPKTGVSLDLSKANSSLNPISSEKPASRDLCPEIKKSPPKTMEVKIESPAPVVLQDNEITESKEIEEKVEIPEVVETHEHSLSPDVSDNESLNEGSTTDEGEERDGNSRVKYTRACILNLKNSSLSNLDLNRYKHIIEQIEVQRNANRSRSYQPRRVIKIPASITIKGVEDAFVPSKLRTDGANEEGDSLKALSKELNIMLNRLSDVNFQETVSDIKKRTTSSEELKLLANIIFQKGIRQSKYSKIFASMCQQLKELETKGSDRFGILILQLTQELFNTPLEVLIKELNATIDEKIVNAKDDAIKRLLEEDRETNVLKKTESYYGNITFIGELYLCGVIKVRTIIDCLKKLKESTAPEALPSMIILLQLCGPDLEQNGKNILDSCFHRLSQVKESDNIETHLFYKVQELVELRACGWKSSDTKPAQIPQENVPRRTIDDKQRRSFNQMDLKRKPAQSVNPITPSSLAVTQQSYDSRKLGPSIANWSQGSGLLQKPSDDGHIKSNQQGSFTTINRSREASPRVPSGPQGAWANPLPEVLSCKKEQKSYIALFESIEPRARSLVETLYFNGGTNSDEIIRECKQEERPALLHKTLDLLMDLSKERRITAGRWLVQQLDEGVLKETDIITACQKFFEFSNDDWLEEYPKGWLYVAEIFHHLIKEVSGYFSLLMKIVDQLSSQNYAAEVIAHCLRLSSEKIGVDALSNILKTNRFSWQNLGVSAANLDSFVSKWALEFTLTSNDFRKSLKDLDNMLRTSTSNEQFSRFFSHLSSQELPNEYVRDIMSTILEASSVNCQDIHSIANSLEILVDHDQNREYDLLCGLQNFSPNKDLVMNWTCILSEHKVISSEAIEEWRKRQKDNVNFSNMNEILSSFFTTS